MNDKQHSTNLNPLSETPQSNPLTQSETPPDSMIQLGGNNHLDLTGLNDEQKEQLKVKHAETMIDVNKKAQELVVDVSALDKSLDTMVQHTCEVAKEGQDVTITHTQSSSAGRTEIIMGTSEAAKKGKLSRSQTGQQDMSPVVWGAIAFIIVAFIILAAVMR